MSITRVAALQGAAAVNTATGTAAIDVGALSLQEDDVLIVSVVRGLPTTNLNMSASANESGALTEVADLYVDASVDTNLWVGYSVQGASADATITMSGLGTVAGSCCYIVVQYRGCDTSSPIMASSTASGFLTDRADPPSVSLSSNTKVVAVYAAVQGHPTAWPAPSDVSNFLQQTGDTYARIGVGDKDVTASSFNPTALTDGEDATFADSWLAATLALEPGSAVSLRPTKLTNSQTFHGASIEQGEVGFTATLLDEGQLFYSPLIVLGIAVESTFLSQNQQFFGAALSVGWGVVANDSSRWERATNAADSFFDGHIFDLDIFDGSPEFQVQDAADSNWTRQS